jgi:hypothetical protein
MFGVVSTGFLFILGISKIQGGVTQAGEAEGDGHHGKQAARESQSFSRGATLGDDHVSPVAIHPLCENAHQGRSQGSEASFEGTVEGIDDCSLLLGYDVSEHGVISTCLTPTDGQSHEHEHACKQAPSFGIRREDMEQNQRAWDAHERGKLSAHDAAFSRKLLLGSVS